MRKYGEQGFRKVKGFLDTLSIVGLLFTLVVMFALKRDLIVERPGIILQLAVPMTLFFWGMFGLVYLVGWRLGFGYEDSVAVAFNSTGRDFEIAIAIAITVQSHRGVGHSGRPLDRGAGDARAGVDGAPHA